jgi:hypothetical protein
MAIREEDQDRIERYLLGKLTAAERTALEAELVNNLALATALAEERDVMQIARATRMLELKDSMQAHAMERRKRPQPKIWPVLAVMGAAAAIFVVVYFAWMRPPAYQRFAANFIHERANGGSLKGGKMIEIPPLQQAIALLDKNEPNMAIAQLHTIRQDTSETGHEALFYLGVAHAIKENRDSSRLYLMKYHYIPGGNHRQDGEALMKKF